MVAAAVAVALLSGCSAETQHEWPNLAMPDPATEQARHIFELWRWAWVAALATGAIVWGLMGWVVVRYRRRHVDEIPVQTRYNLPLEIFYTVAPIVMVIVFFYHTVNVQNAVLDDTEQDRTIEVVGQQWSWTFNHRLEGTEGPVVYTSGSGGDIPTLVLPVGRDHPVQPAQPRRHPLLRHPRVPDDHGRRPRPGQPLRGHPRHRGHLRRQVP